MFRGRDTDTRRVQGSQGGGLALMAGVYKVPYPPPGEEY